MIDCESGPWLVLETRLLSETRLLLGHQA